MKKKGYYEYTPQIYPRKLWVMYNTSEEEIDKCFTNMKGEPLVHNGEPMSEGSYGGMVYDECMSKAGKYFGNLVVFPKKSDMTMKTVMRLIMFYRLSTMRAIWKGCITAEMSTRHTSWVGYVIASTTLVWESVIL
jgi:hypothetical protein